MAENEIKNEVNNSEEPNTEKSIEDRLKESAAREKERIEAEKEEQRKIKEAEKEERRKEKEALKAEIEKEKEARRAEREKEKEVQRAEKEALRADREKEKEAQRAEREALRAEKEKEKEAQREQKENENEIKMAGKEKLAEGKKAFKEQNEVQNASKKPDEGEHERKPKGEGVWKSFVDKMNSESAGDDRYGRDIEDEAPEEIFFSPEEKKRKRRLGLVKLYGTLGAIAAIAIIIAFFSVKNNSFRHIYEQGVKAYNDEDYDSAIATFEKLALSEEGEKNVDVLNYLAQSYIKNNRYQDALDVYNRALQADPTFGPAVTGLCEMYTQMKDGKALNATLDKYRGSNMEEYIADYMVANPSMNPDAGKYEEDFEVALTGDQNVPIFYTLDGSDPNEQSQIYSRPLKISEGTTQIKAIAINTLGIRSGIVDKSYTVEYRIPDEPKIALNSGIYVTGQTVTISGDEGCDIYYTTDGSTPTKYSEKYTGPLRLVKGNVILTAIAISNHGKESAMTSKNYIIVQNSKELEEVEKMNQQPATSSSENENESSNGEGEASSENPNETDGWYTEEYESEEGEDKDEEEGLFDWLFTDRDGRRNR